MKAIVIYLSVLVLLLICSGCGTFLGHSNSVNGNKLSEINAVIGQYEAEGPNAYEKLNIADYYAYRSICYAHHLPKYAMTRGSVDMVQLGIEVDPMFTIVGIVVFPIGVVVDTVKYPIQFIRTLNVSESDIEQAISDMKKARELGYTYFAHYPFQMLGPDNIHLDVLGFSLNDANNKTNQVESVVTTPDE
ncbi:hypothetical protein P4C99_14325 [Pontiellaceae bacterium B1224]|nr:hypothetical protein [Pontiellaceae bacterium B1224]